MSYPQVDHSESGYINKPKKGRCGASWALAATSTLEGANALNKKKKPPAKISTQELIDCQRKDTQENAQKFGENY